MRRMKLDRRMRRVRATLIWEYETEPEFYEAPDDPTAMAKEDLEGDPAAVLEGTLTIKEAEFVAAD